MVTTHPTRNRTWQNYKYTPQRRAREGLGNRQVIGRLINYTSFGESYAKTEAVPQRYQWTGRGKSGVSGLQYNRYRWYFDEVGRWRSRDPIYYRRGVNLYGYVYSRPIQWNDPSGLGPRDPMTTGYEPRTLGPGEITEDIPPKEIHGKKGTLCATFGHKVQLTDEDVIVEFWVKKADLKTKEEQEDCECLCANNAWAWIQHSKSAGGGWRFDNAGAKLPGGSGAGSGRGQPSDPSSNRQPLDKKPWFGGNGNIRDEIEDEEDWANFPLDPKPQSAITDQPTAPMSEFYVTQLACVATGSVYAYLEWKASILPPSYTENPADMPPLNPEDERNPGE